MTQFELLDHLIQLEDGKEYTAVQLTEKIKGYYNNKPFYAMNDTKTIKDRIYYCDFNPRKKYMYNGKWHMIKKHRELTAKEKYNFLNVYDKNKREFRKIDIGTLSYLRIGRCRFRVDQVKTKPTNDDTIVEKMITSLASRFSIPRVTVKRLP